MGGDVILTHSTIATNQSVVGGAGVHVHSRKTRAVSLHSTVLAANTGAQGNFAHSGSGAIVLNAYFSLIGDPSEEINGDNNSNIFNNHPGLEPLADNGCGISAGEESVAACAQTHALSSNSPAINAAETSTGLDTDQRGSGFPRVLGSAADIGAYERK